VLPQDPLFLDQVRQHFPLAAVRPTGDSEQQQVEGRDVDHLRSLHQSRDLALPATSAETWDTTGRRTLVAADEAMTASIGDRQTSAVHLGVDI